MTEFNRQSPEWAAIRGYAAARVSELTLALRERQPHERAEEKRTRIEELIELVRRFEPEQIDKFDDGVDFNI